MTLPNTVFVGASKCGTTTLYDLCKAHDDFYVPLMKEIHYFSSPELMKRQGGNGDRFVIETIVKGRDGYHERFSDAVREKVICDFSPSYFFFAETTANRIRGELGEEVKIVITLRDPIDKVYSQYSHLVRDARETLSFSEALKAEAKRREEGWSDMFLYLESGFYTEKLRTWIETFDKNQAPGHILLSA